MMRSVTDHWRRIRALMQHWGQRTPERPTLPSREERLLRARLVLEEALEFVEACNVAVTLDGVPVSFADLQMDVSQAEVNTPFGEECIMIAMVDAAADLSVVTIGSLVAMGVQDIPVLEEVDANNALKIHPNMGGSKNPVTGKWEKSPNHPDPHFRRILQDMGWNGGAKNATDPAETRTR